MKELTLLGLIVGLSAFSINAAETPACCSAAFAGVAAAELPAKTASIIKTSKDPKSTSAQTVRSAVALNPAAAPAIVGAVARSLPSVAAIAAGAAATEEPEQAEAIAKAATAAAPSKAGAITEQVVRAVPAKYEAIAAAVASVAPKAGRQILAGIARAIPGLKYGIEQSLSQYRGEVPVLLALDHARKANARLAAADPSPIPPLGGPTVGDPFVPFSGNTGTITPGNSDVVPPGGRNYSTP